jgi:hypothetical protein
MMSTPTYQYPNERLPSPRPRASPLPSPVALQRLHALWHRGPLRTVQGRAQEVQEAGCVCGGGGDSDGGGDGDCDGGGDGDCDGGGDGDGDGGGGGGARLAKVSRHQAASEGSAGAAYAATSSTAHAIARRRQDRSGSSDCSASLRSSFCALSFACARLSYQHRARYAACPTRTGCRHGGGPAAGTRARHGIARGPRRGADGGPQRRGATRPLPPARGAARAREAGARQGWRTGDAATVQSRLQSGWL